jgi:cellulose synthase/poly-beta-1,6-N-acetylglucosamine synthase-like glycosyltransferase
VDALMKKQEGWHIAILIPARNEETLLPRCLASIDRARAALPEGVTADVVLVADSCTDETPRIAREMLGETGVMLCCEYGRVGEARELAATVALRRYDGELSRCWLANTDADCSVPESWLLHQLFLAMQGVEAVAGVVSVDSFGEHEPGVAERFRETYVIHSDGSHPHVHGANLGVRADVYEQAGGWKRLETAEDHDLWNRLKHEGRVCWSLATISVETSGRRVGRAPLGFAGALAAHNEAQL